MDVTAARADDANPPAKDVAACDLQSVDASDWPAREFPAGVVRPENGVVPVVLRQSILNHIHLHGQQTTEVEICGVLIGRGYRDEQGPFVYIEGAIRGDHAESQVAQVTFTAETWNHIYAIADNAWPESRILGWYHTHPGFGIFLSGMDLFIHDNFFNSPEQFAIVYDPLSGEEGIFLWTAGKATRGTFLVEPDEPENPPQRPRNSAAATAGAGGPAGDLQEQIARLQKQQTFLTFMIFAVGLLAVAWPWVLFRWIIVPNLPPRSSPSIQREESPPPVKPRAKANKSSSKKAPQADTPTERKPMPDKPEDEGKPADEEKSQSP